MKYDPEKSFGYPVLREAIQGENKSAMDYPTSEYQPDIQLRIDPKQKEKIIVEYELATSVPELLALVEDKKARLILRASCPKTFWSECFDIETEGEIELEAQNLRDQLELSIVLVTLQDIQLTLSKFHGDYEGESFSIPKHTVLAWHNPFTYTVEPEQFKLLRALIDIQTDPNIPPGDMRFNGAEDYVVVSIHPDMKTAIDVAAQAGDMQKSIVLASFYQSIVCQMLTEMILLSREGEDIAKRRWTAIIDAKCQKESINWEDANSIATNAQKLLGNCMGNLSTKGFGVEK